MRCIMCDRLLSNYEATIRDKITGEFKDTCKKCLTHIDNDIAVEDYTRFLPNEILKELEKEL